MSPQGRELQIDGERVGVAIGSAVGCMQQPQIVANQLQNGHFRKISPFFIPRMLVNMGAGRVSLRFKAKGPQYCSSTACAAGLHSIGEGFRSVALGLADVMVCV